MSKKYQEVLSEKNPVILYLNASSKYNVSKDEHDKKERNKHKTKAAMQLEDFIREDVKELTNRNLKYNIKLTRLYCVITISTRDSLSLVEQIDYKRELTAQEQNLLVYLGANRGYDYFKNVDINSRLFKKQLKDFEGIRLPNSFPHSDYSYFAWNCNGSTQNKKISLSETVESLNTLVGLLGHEAGHTILWSSKRVGEEATILEETFCDFFGEEYKVYFSENHAGIYFNQIKKQNNRNNNLIEKINTIEDLLDSGKLEKAERLMVKWGGNYNQAYLIHSKIYSCYNEINLKIGGLFEKYGAKAILLMNKMSAFSHLDMVCEDSKTISFGEIISKTYSPGL